MKNSIGKFSAIIALYSMLSAAGANAQSLKDLMKNKTKTDTSSNAKSKNVLKSFNDILEGGSGLSSSEVAEGLKAALDQGVAKGVEQLSATDGYLGNLAIKIPMPQEAKKVEQTLRSFGLGKQVDQAINSMNRAAEDAAKSAAPIFINAIKNMTIQDAMSILSGKQDVATQYLKSQSSAALTEAFKPVITASLEKTDATKYWNTVFSSYNKVASEKINPDLTAYVTQKALDGLFYQVALEEANIRKNPAARTSEILQKVFAK